MNNLEYSQAIKDMILLGAKYNLLARRIPSSYIPDFFHKANDYAHMVLGNTALFEKDGRWEDKRESVRKNLELLRTYIDNGEYLFGEQNE